MLTSPVLTANYTSRQQNRQPSNNFSQRNQNLLQNTQQRGTTRNFQSGGNRQNSTRNATYCQFCNIQGHPTKECRKLSRFLRENNISIANPSAPNPVANVTTAGSTSMQPTWLFDTGASNHVTFDPSSLQTVSEYGGPDEIILGNGTNLPISHIGSTHITTPQKSLFLRDILCVPNLKRNLISVAKLCKTNNVSVEFFSSYFIVKDLRTGAHLMRGENTDDIYHATTSSLHQLNYTTTKKSLDWHHKLGHPSIKVFQAIASSLGLNSISNVHCSSCAVNKSHKLPFGKNSFVATKPLQLIYSDVWGPVKESIDHFYLLCDIC